MIGVIKSFKTLSMGSLALALLMGTAFGERLPTTEAPSRARAYQLFLEGTALAREGQLAAARNKLEQVLELDPEATSVHSILARLCLRQSDPVCAETEARRALASTEADAEAHRVLASLALGRYGSSHEREELTTALEHLEQATTIEPTDAWAWSIWIRLLVTDDRLDQAESVARRAAAIPGFDPALPWLSLARQLLSLGRRDQAAEVLARAGVEGPGAGPIYELLADLEAQMGDKAGEAAALEALVALRPDRAELARRLGLVRLELADPWGAQQVLRQARALRPGDPRLRIDLAAALVPLGRGDEAWELLEGVPASLASPRLLLLRARAAELAGHPARAADQIEALLERLGDEQRQSFGPALRLRAARDRLAAGQPERAIAQLDAIGEPALGVRVRLDALDQMGRVEQADAFLEKVAGSADADPFLLAARIEWRLRQGGASAALVEARRLLATGTDLATADVARILAGWQHTAVANELLGGIEAPEAPDPEWWRAVAAVAYADRRFEQAEHAYRKLLEVAPSDDSALNDLGYLLAEQGRELEEAVSLCRRALALRPDEPAYLDSLGWALHRAGRSREALEVLSRAVYGSGENSDPVMRGHLGDVFIALGQVERAVSEWEAALGLSDAEDESLRARIRRARELAAPEGQ